MFTAKIRRGIQMSDKTDGGFRLTARCGRNGPVNVTVFTHSGILDAHGFHLLHQNLRQVKLAGCGGYSGTVLITGGIDPYIIQ